MKIGVQVARVWTNQFQIIESVLCVVQVTVYVQAQKVYNLKNCCSNMRMFLYVCTCTRTCPSGALAQTSRA